ncbi:hypothetical protein ACHAQJ_000030 [Trichoderma viride]
MATITHSTAITTGFCDNTDIVDTAVVTFPNVVTITQTETTTGSVLVSSSTSTRTMVLYAPMVQLNFHASDLPVSTTASSASSTTTSPSSQQSTTSAADNNTVSKSSGGLSSGAKVGLGVGLGLGVAFLLAFSAFIYYYRRARNARVPLGSELPNNQVPEVDQGPKIKQSPAQVYEMGVYHAPAELPGNIVQGGYEGGYNGSDAHRYS